MQLTNKTDHYVAFKVISCKFSILCASCFYCSYSCSNGQGNHYLITVRRSKLPTQSSTVCALILALYFLGRLVMLQVAGGPLYRDKQLSEKKVCLTCSVFYLQVSLAFSLLLVTMQAQREAPPDLQCKDKFLVQSVAAENGAETQDISAAMVPTLTLHLCYFCQFAPCCICSFLAHHHVIHPCGFVMTVQQGAREGC